MTQQAEVELVRSVVVGGKKYREDEFEALVAGWGGRGSFLHYLVEVGALERTGAHTLTTVVKGYARLPASMLLGLFAGPRRAGEAAKEPKAAEGRLSGETGAGGEPKAAEGRPVGETGSAGREAPAKPKAAGGVGATREERRSEAKDGPAPTRPRASSDRWLALRSASPEDSDEWEAEEAAAQESRRTGGDAGAGAGESGARKLAGGAGETGARKLAGGSGENDARKLAGGSGENDARKLAGGAGESGARKLAGGSGESGAWKLAGGSGESGARKLAGGSGENDARKLAGGSGAGASGRAGGEADGAAGDAVVGKAGEARRTPVPLPREMVHDAVSAAIAGGQRPAEQVPRDGPEPASPDAGASGVPTVRRRPARGEGRASEDEVADVRAQGAAAGSAGREVKGTVAGQERAAASGWVAESERTGPKGQAMAATTGASSGGARADARGQASGTDAGGERAGSTGRVGARVEAVEAASARDAVAAEARGSMGPKGQVGSGGAGAERVEAPAAGVADGAGRGGQVESGGAAVVERREGPAAGVADGAGSKRQESSGEAAREDVAAVGRRAVLSLEELVIVGGPLRAEVVGQIGGELAAALQAAGGHGDVRPGNVAVLGSDVRVRLSGSGPGGDVRKDMHGLGATLFFAATGRSVPKQTPVIAGLSDLAPPVHTQVPGFSRAVSQVIARLLKRRPEDGFARWDEVVAAFGSVERRRGDLAIDRWDLRAALGEGP